MTYCQSTPRPGTGALGGGAVARGAAPRRGVAGTTPRPRLQNPATATTAAAAVKAAIRGTMSLLTQGSGDSVTITG